MNDYCEYCGKRLRWSEEFPCPTCRALRKIIAENPQRARNILDRAHLEKHLRISTTAYIKILQEEVVTNDG
jgi:hypothetical protein